MSTAALVLATIGRGSRASARMVGPESAQHDAQLVRLRGLADQAAVERSWTLGRAMPMEEAVTIAVGD